MNTSSQSKIQNKIIGLKELRENTEEYVTRVAKGESFTVVRRSKPIFRLSPIETNESSWETVADFTQLDPRGVSAKDILKAIRTIDG